MVLSVFACECVYEYVCERDCIYVCACMYLSVFVCECVCKYENVYVCVHAYV